jgi:hypothetical protein
MHCTVVVSFAPGTLADATDSLTVQSDLTSFHVALYARRDPPALTLPAVLDCGACLVDHTSVMKFPFRNSGGRGSFRLSFVPDGRGAEQWERGGESRGGGEGRMDGGKVKEGAMGGERGDRVKSAGEGCEGEQWTSIEERGRADRAEQGDGTERNSGAEQKNRTECGDADIQGDSDSRFEDVAVLRPCSGSASASGPSSNVNKPSSGQSGFGNDSNSIQWGPFTLSPAFFQLDHSKEATITVAFTPRSEDPFLETLQLACDNCRSQTLEVTGRGAVLDVRVTELDGKGVQDGELEQGVWFEATAPGAEVKRTVTVSNQTALDVPVRCSLARVPEALEDLRGVYSQEIGGIAVKCSLKWAGNRTGGQELGAVQLCSGEFYGGGDVDRTALLEGGARACHVFRVEPDEVVIGANSSAVLELTFAPHRVDLFQTFASFEVDTRRVNFKGGVGLGESLEAFGEEENTTGPSQLPSSPKKHVSRRGASRRNPLASPSFRTTLSATEERNGTRSLERTNSHFKKTLPSYSDTSADNGGRPVTTVELLLGGVGSYIMVEMSPGVVSFPGEMLIGRTYSHQLTLGNKSAAAARFSWVRVGSETGPETSGIEGFTPHSSCNLREAAGRAPHLPRVVFRPQTGSVPPFEEFVVEVEVTPERLGQFEMAFECRIGSSLAGPLPLQIRGCAVSPAVCFDQASVDFGLVERGHVAEVEVVVRNTSEIPAVWAVEQIMETGTESQGALGSQQLARFMAVNSGSLHKETESRQQTAKVQSGGSEPETASRREADTTGSEAVESSREAGVDMALRETESGIANGTERGESCIGFEGGLERFPSGSFTVESRVEMKERTQSWGPSSSFCRSLGLVDSQWTTFPKSLSSRFPPHALQISPSSGFLGALSSARILVSFSPAHCQPLHAVLELLSGPVSEQDTDSASCAALLRERNVESKHVLATATVVAPRGVLDQSELDLGTCFVNMPVERSVTLLNLASVPIVFSWARESLGDPSESLEVSVVPDSGRIAAKGRQELLVRISPVREPCSEAESAGMAPSSVEKVLTCDVDGADVPLALRILAKVQGLRFSFEVREGGAALQSRESSYTSSRPSLAEGPRESVGRSGGGSGYSTGRLLEVGAREARSRGEGEPGGEAASSEKVSTSGEGFVRQEGTRKAKLDRVTDEAVQEGTVPLESTAEESGTEPGTPAGSGHVAEGGGANAGPVMESSAEREQLAREKELQPGPTVQETEPLASVPVHLDFGSALSIGERKALTLVVRNHSGVRAPVSVQLLHMGAPLQSKSGILGGTFGSTGGFYSVTAGNVNADGNGSGSGTWPLDASQSTATTTRETSKSTGSRRVKKPLLGAAHETGRNFSSALGQTVLGKRQVRTKPSGFQGFDCL